MVSLNFSLHIWILTGEALPAFNAAPLGWEKAWSGEQRERDAVRGPSAEHSKVRVTQKDQDRLMTFVSHSLSR
jgi:hypothetical protein